MKTALVTGAAGFVGRHMAEALEMEGYDVLGVDIRRGLDVRDLFRASSTIDPGEVDLVVHCAAVVGGRTMIEGEPLMLAAEDLSIDASLFRWALRARPGRIVYFSSSAAYPTDLQQHPDTYDEDHRDLAYRALVEDDIDLASPYMPDQTYGWVKLTGERLAMEANAEGIKTHVFRPFSGYGADQDNTYPFPAIMERARRRESPLEVWSNGVRDWVHIDDIVGAVMAAIDQDFLEPVNICTGVGTPFVKLAIEAGLAVGYEADVKILDDKPKGVHYRVGDPTLMETFYIPKIELEEGIRRALA